MDEKLNEFWNRSIKFPNAGSSRAKTLTGLLYEQYTGWRYESTGWEVDYHGMRFGLSDGGIDLICRKSDYVRIIQCKNWSVKRQVKPLVIKRLKASEDSYRERHRGLKVKAFIYSSVSLTAEAKTEAERCGIAVCENIALRRFPCVKCVKSEGLYYLPEDLGYFDVIIESGKGDIYLDTIGEAEAEGFSYAYKHV